MVQMHPVTQIAFCVGWVYDLELKGPHNLNGLELFSARSRVLSINGIGSDPNSFKEKVLGRKVLRIQVEPNASTPKAPLGTQFAQLRNLGWYVAALVPPWQKVP